MKVIGRGEERERERLLPLETATSKMMASNHFIRWTRQTQWISIKNLQFLKIESDMSILCALSRRSYQAQVTWTTFKLLHIHQVLSRMRKTDTHKNKQTLPKLSTNKWEIIRRLMTIKRKWVHFELYHSKESPCQLELSVSVHIFDKQAVRDSRRVKCA